MSVTVIITRMFTSANKTTRFAICAIFISNSFAWSEPQSQNLPADYCFLGPPHAANIDQMPPHCKARKGTPREHPSDVPSPVVPDPGGFQAIGRWLSEQRAIPPETERKG